MKKLLAILLTALLLLPLGLAIRTDRTDAEVTDDIWAQITAYENDCLSKKGVEPARATERDFAAMIDGVKDIVERWNGCVPGSLVQNGAHLIWDGTDGTGYGYSPRLRQKLRSDSLTGADPEAVSGIETVSYAARGGTADSKKVALFEPYYGLDTSFTDQYQTEADSIAQTIGGTYTVYRTTAATIDNIANALETCGVVIFDSHGDTDYVNPGNDDDFTSRANTSYLCLQSGSGLTSVDQASVQGPYGTYKHAYYAGTDYYNSSIEYYCVDGTAIRNHMDRTAPNSFLWMAICLGMATDGMEAPLREQGVEVVYGYSQSVTFAGDYAWEESFWGKMKTGSAVKDAIAYMKQQVGVKDPYERYYPSYPIVVSSEDVFPGHGHVDAVQTVNSTWVLFADYTVTARSNNTSYGTASASGYTVTASPKTGYYAESATLSPADAATVTQTGNVFTLSNVTRDCTLTVNFAPTYAITVSFDANGGTGTMDAVSACAGDAYTLPACGFTAPGGQQFAGWRMQGDDTLYAAGQQITLTADTTLAAQWIAVTVYTKVTSAPDNWSGKYLIVYENGNLAFDGSLETLDKTRNIKPITVENEQITVLSDEDNFFFTIAPYGNEYSIRSAGGYYISGTEDVNKLNTSDTTASEISLTFDNGKVDIVSNTSHLRFSTASTSKRFRFFRASSYINQKPIALYKATTLPEFDGTVEIDERDVQFNGKTPYVIADGTAKTPRFTVRASDGSVVDPSNYTYEYRENINAGTAYMIVTFTDLYSGTAQGWFKIYLTPTDYTKVENRDDGIYIEWNPVEGAAGYVIYRRAWNATATGWTSFVRWNNTTELFWTDTQTYAGTRYQYGVKAYFDRRVDPVSGATIGGNVGDNYNLGIVGPLKTTVRITTRTLNSVTGGNKQITAKWGASKNFTGYQVQIATDAKFTQNRKTVTISDYTKAQYTFKNLNAKTTYYVRVRSYHIFDGTTYYGRWSDAKNAKTK